MRALRIVHRWIGIVLAIPILLVCISGGLLLGRDAYYRWRWPEVNAAAGHAGIESHAAALSAIDARFGGVGVRTVKFPRQGINAFHVYLADGSEAFVHPETGDVIGRWRPADDPGAFLFDLHANLLIAGSGRTLNGYLALVLVFLGVTGLALWLPRRATTFRLRHALPRGTGGAEMLKAHAATGAWVGLPLLVFAATGAGLVFYEPIGRVVGSVFDRQPSTAPSATVARREAAHASWSDILAAAQSAFPETGPSMCYPGTGKNAVITFRMRLHGETHPNGRSYVLVDPYTAQVVQTIDARRQGSGTRAMYALYPIHAAKLGGPVWVTVAAVTGIASAWLALSGAWAYGARFVRRLLTGRRGVLRALDLENR